MLYEPTTFFHPGVTLAEKLMELRMSNVEFATRTGKPEQTVTAIMKCKSAVTPDMAVVFEDVLRIPARYWLTSQKNYDEYQARLHNKALVRKAKDWSKQFNYAALVKLEAVPPAKKLEERTHNLLKFFGVSSPEAWKEIYLEGALPTQFSISLRDDANPQALSVWLRLGELAAEKLEPAEYAKPAFQDLLSRILKKDGASGIDSFDLLQELCANTGVCLVATPLFPGIETTSAARWVRQRPLIQLTNTDLSLREFWRTFFHEAGHIVLHGKKDIFLQQPNNRYADPVKEQQAEKFAAKYMAAVA